MCESCFIGPAEGCTCTVPLAPMPALPEGYSEPKWWNIPQAASAWSSQGRAING